jgi:hypothetical protein
LVYSPSSCPSFPPLFSCYPPILLFLLHLPLLKIFFPLLLILQHLTSSSTSFTYCFFSPILGSINFATCITFLIVLYYLSERQMRSVGCISSQLLCLTLEIVDKVICRPERMYIL